MGGFFRRVVKRVAFLEELSNGWLFPIELSKGWLFPSESGQKVLVK